MPRKKAKVMQEKALGNMDSEPSSAAENQSAPAAEDSSTELVQGVYVKTIPGLKSFRRAGFGFNEQGFGIALSALNDGQVELLESESKLVVERCTFETDDDYIGRG